MLTLKYDLFMSPSIRVPGMIHSQIEGERAKKKRKIIKKKSKLHSGTFFAYHGV
jgi:hypothetical protein